jgi:predicted GIY-YIG superfamily endonuclease
MKKYWIRENCIEEALKYKSRKEFSRKSNGAYDASLRNGWLDNVCGHMISKRLSWTKETCSAEALKYNTKSEFIKNSRSAYMFALRKQWISNICQHMAFLKKPNNYWNKERCVKEALKYNNRSDFQNNSEGAYNSARRKHFLNEICDHMDIIGNLLKRCIYAAEFKNNSVYIGLTFSFNKRIIQHMSHIGSQVYKESMLLNELPQFKQLTDYIEVNLAMKWEGLFVDKYRNDGWNILNIANTGAIGGGIIKWSKEICKVEAKKFTTKMEFFTNSKGAYLAACRNNWLDEITKHMIMRVVIKSKEECHAEALKYKTRNEFRVKSCAAYTKAVKNGWLNDICKHMKRPVNYNKSIKIINI